LLRNLTHFSIGVVDSNFTLYLSHALPLCYETKARSNENGLLFLSSRHQGPLHYLAMTTEKTTPLVFAQT